MARARDMARRLDWREVALYGAAFAVPFLAYLLTLGPATMDQDASELATAAYVLGVPHPSGYPLYMLLSKAWQLLVPLGSIAYRMNLFSAVCGAATCVTAAWVCRLLGCRRSAALLGGLTAGFFRIFWQQADVAGVRTLNSLFIALIFGAFLVWHRRRTERSLVALALVCGFAFTHHHISLFFSIFFLGFALVTHRPVRAAALLKVAAAVVLPQALYLYVPIRALANPPLNWENARTWEAFRRHVSAAPWMARYGFARRGLELREFLGEQLTILRAELTLAGAAIGLVGFVALARRRPAFWALAAASFVVVVINGSMYKTTFGDVFLIPCVLTVAVWIAVGGEWLVGWAARLAGGLGRGLGNGMARWALPALAVALPAHMAAVNWRGVDLRGDWHIYDYAQRVLAEAEPRSVVVLYGYTAYVASLYLQVVEGRRPDVDLVAVDFSGTRWYPPTVRDAAIRRALEEAQRLRDIGIAGEAEQWVPMLMGVLVSRMEGKRPVACNVDFDGSWLPPPVRVTLKGHPPFGPEGHQGPEGPGWQVLVVEPLRRVAPALGLRMVAVSGTAGRPLAEGIAAAGMTLAPPRVRRGRVLRLGWRWQIGQAVEAPAAVRVFFINQEWLRQPAARGAPLPPAMGFDAAAQLGYAVLPLPVTPVGRALEQDIYVVPPRALAPGRYVIYCALETAAGASPPVGVGEVEVVEGGP